jgi:transporter family-2 protein
MAEGAVTAMGSSYTIGILIAAGGMLVVQNLLMVRMTASASTVLITLVINSGVGLILLLGSLLARNGLGALTEMLSSLKPWHILPGLLGSFFVFAGILGYQRVGPAITISTLVASQIIAGLIADGLKAGALPPRIDVSSSIGAVLLVAGAYLIARGKA